ncbi:MAG: GNAT family N-acetyltransferase [Balneolaceae bacterium]|nr:GNAT family N-acetyltransferase [Balneolaceae bacterium]
MDVKLSISTDVKILGPLCDFTYSWSLSNGLTEKQATHFTVAVSELVTDIILFAYPNKSQAQFEIEYKDKLRNVEIIVQEVGEPFDPDRHRYNPEMAVSDGDFEGAGLRLIRRFCDNFLFINKGKEGKEFHLSKEKVIHDIDELIEQSRKEKPNEPKPADLKKAIPEKEFTYKQVTPSDAEDIAKLIYRTYGYTYSKEDLYFPKKIEQTLVGKEKLGIICRSPKGKAAGYFAILKKTDSNIGEVGEAVVSPNYRKRGIMSKMMEHLIEIAKSNKLAGIFGKAVTLHPVSQKVNHKYGFKTTALMLADSKNIKYKGFNEEYPQPISVVIDFLPIGPTKEKTVYLPSKYKKLLLETYKELDIQVKPKDPKSVKLAKKSDIELEINFDDLKALIVIKKYGSDFYSVLAEMLKSLDEQENLNVIYLDLPLENPSTPQQFKVVEKMGFIYSGLAPLFHQENDFLRLQKLMIPMDLNLIEAFSEFGKKVKKEIGNEYHKNT